MITVIIGTPKKIIQGIRVNVLQESLINVFDMIQTPNLFGETQTFILQNVFEDELIEKQIMDRLSDVIDAPHHIIILADKLLAPEKKKFEKLGIEIREEKKKEEKKEFFDPFVLANAFATGDKKNAWIAFHEVVSRDDEIEKTHGMIWWKLKDMMMKRSVFSPSQLDDMARDLVSIYHDSRLGSGNMKDKLEHFFLTLPDIKKK